MKKYKTTKNEFATSVLILILMIPLIPMEGIYYIAPTIYELVYVYAAFASALAVLMLQIVFIFRGGKYSPFVICLGIIGCYITLLTLAKGGALLASVTNWVYCLPLMALFESTRAYEKRFLNSIKKYLTILVLINLLCMIMFPAGMYPGSISMGLGKIWILGYKSSLQYYVIPMLFLYLLDAIYYNKKTAFLLFSVIAYVEAFLSMNVMLVLGLVICDILIFIVFIKNKPVQQKLMKVSVVSVIAANILIVLFTNIVLSNQYVQLFFYKVLNKDATFSMRTGAWNATVQAIMKNPIIGYGYTSREFRTILFQRATAHAHNLFLELIFEGGIIALILFAFMMYKIIRKLMEKDTPIAKAGYVFLMTIFIMYIFENIFQKSSGGLWLIFAVSYYSTYTDLCYSKEDRKHAEYTIHRKLEYKIE